MGKGMKYVASFFLAVISLTCYGQTRSTGRQNLVINPDFEISVYCPRFGESMLSVAGWYLSHIYSADYFHTCVEPSQRFNLGVPRNMFGYQQPRSGNAYAGISFNGEALVGRLSRPMVKDSIYRVEFFVSLADSSDVGTRFLGMYISYRAPRFTLDNRRLISRFTLDHPPQIQNPPDRFLIDTVNWVSINGFYTAQGGEQYIAIGGFFPFHDSLVKQIRPQRTLTRNFYRGWERHLGYYYIDDVSVIPYGMNWQTDVYYLLRYVYFDFDEIELLPESVDELNRLSAHLKRHPTYNINIRGHTDNFGTDEYNQILSINRAKAVVDWLINVGEIAPERITYDGAGSHEPIADNQTEFGRSLNRRVEFILTDTVTNMEIRMPTR